jgi:hypothetical protein
MTDTALDPWTVEQQHARQVSELRNRLARCEFEAALAAKEANMPGGCRELVLAHLDRLAADEEPDFGELKQAFTWHVHSIEERFDEAADLMFRSTVRKQLLDQMRDWATTTPLVDDPQQQRFGAIRWDTLDDRAKHVAAARARAAEFSEGADTIRKQLIRLEEERRKKEIAESAQRMRSRG